MSEADDEVPTPRQIDRTERTRRSLTALGIPTYHLPLYLHHDDEEVRLRDPRDVAYRAAALWAVARCAEGVTEPVVTTSFLMGHGIWEHLSPRERTFLQEPGREPKEVNLRVWGLEGLVALLWALGQLDTLAWPDRLCDGPRLTRIMGGDLTPPPVLRGAALRPASEILDAQDLAMCQNWAVRHMVSRVGLPPDLTFVFQPPGAYGLLAFRRKKETRLNMGVVAERHQALNWLTGFPAHVDWDEVDTPT